MTARQKILVTGLLAMLASVVIFTPVRTGIMETSYIKTLILSSEKITLALEEFEKEKVTGGKNLSTFCVDIKKKYPHLALIAIADPNKNILITDKNDAYIKTNSIFNSIIDNFINNEYTTGKGKNFIIRYFDQTRFYIFVKTAADGNILLLFPYRLGRRMVIELILQIILIIMIILAGTMSLYIKQKRKEAPYNAAHFSIISRLKKEKSVNKNNPEIEKRISDSAKGYVSEYLGDLFGHLSSRYSTGNISFCLRNSETGNFHMLYELRGKTFIKSEGRGISSMHIGEEIGDELKKSSVFVQERGGKITFPIIYKKSLLGVIIIARESPFRGPEINGIKSQVSLAGKPLGQYLQFD